MAEKQITLDFNMEDEVHNRVYYALKNLPDYYSEPDLSKAIIQFINHMVSSIGECEERTNRCEEVLKALLTEQAGGKVEWQ